MGFPGGKTADPSTPLRSGRDDKGEGGCVPLLYPRDGGLQIPPLRSFGAPVGMTRRGS